MPLLDLSTVTKALSNLLEFRVKAALADLGQPPAAVSAVTLSALPADKLAGDETIGLYLYHITEDASSKNVMPASQDVPATRFQSMGLNLHYQLNTHSDLNGEQGGIWTQLLFGLALKTFHDYASINKDTAIGGTKVFPAALSGTDNIFRIALQSVQPTEAPHYWTGGVQPLRLAAYYIVSVIYLEPDTASVFAGRVLRYGVQSFVGGAPYLEASRSLVIFRGPGESVDRQQDSQPAQAPVGGKIQFHGSGLSADQTALLVNNSRFDNPVEVGLTWGVVASNNQIAATVTALIGSYNTLPGIYSAAAKVTVRRRMPDGSTQDFPQTSNEVPFLVVPDIISPAPNVVATANAQGVVIVNGGVFDDPDIPPDAVKVFVGPQSVPREPTATLTAGHFRVSSPTQLRFRFPISGLNSGDVLPFRIIINGAENTPRWVAVP